MRNSFQTYGPGIDYGAITKSYIGFLEVQLNSHSELDFAHISRSLSSIGLLLEKHACEDEVIRWKLQLMKSIISTSCTLSRVEKNKLVAKCTDLLSIHSVSEHQKMFTSPPVAPWKAGWVT